MTTSGDYPHTDRGIPRLAFCFVASILLHLGIALGTGPSASNSQHRKAMEVELRTVTAEPHELLPSKEAVHKMDSSAPAKNQNESEQIAIAPPDLSKPGNTTTLLSLPLDPYYASSEVDTRAEPLNEIDLVYPLVPLQQRLAGIVRLNIFVNERGGIDKIEVVDSEPSGIFEEAALQAVTALKFSPAIKDGIAVKNRKTIAVNFDPYERINTP